MIADRLQVVMAEDDEGHATLLGAAACLVKPVDYGRFSEMIQQLAGFLQAMRLPGDGATSPDHGA